jgi:hypothetical protein
MRPTRTRTRSGPSTESGQANLVALVTALVAVTTVTVLGVAVADGVLAGADREPGERHAAAALAERLVAADSPLTARRNVIDATALGGVTASDIRRWVPVVGDRSLRVRLDGRVLASKGTPDGGTTMRRIVLVERAQSLHIRPAFGGGNDVTLPRRTPTVTLDIDPPKNVSVTEVHANRRVVLRDSGGLRGRFTVSLSRHRTVSLRFLANATLTRGDVDITLSPRETTKARLVVTVDD